MEHVLKLCEIPKYLPQDCLKMLRLLLMSSTMVQISENNAILTQARKTIE